MGTETNKTTIQLQLGREMKFIELSLKEKEMESSNAIPLSAFAFKQGAQYF